MVVCRAALFGRDFTRHIAAIDMLLSALADDFDAVLAALDLVFRWVVLRLCEGNMQALVKVCELTNALLNTLYENVRSEPFSHLLRAAASSVRFSLAYSMPACACDLAAVCVLGKRWGLSCCCRATSWRTQRPTCCCPAWLKRPATARSAPSWT
jgi:hypothetical protein